MLKNGLEEGSLDKKNINFEKMDSRTGVEPKCPILRGRGSGVNVMLSSKSQTWREPQNRLKIGSDRNIDLRKWSADQFVVDFCSECKFL